MSLHSQRIYCEGLCKPVGDFGRYAKSNEEVPVDLKQGRIIIYVWYYNLFSDGSCSIFIKMKTF